MRISGTEPSSVILSQTMKFKKLNSDGPKVPKQAEAKRDVTHVIMISDDLSHFSNMYNLSILKYLL